MPVRQTQGIMGSRHRFMPTYTPTGIDACAPNPRNNGFQAPYTVWGFKIIKGWGVVGSGAPRVPPQVPPPGPGNVFSIVGAPILQTGLVRCRVTVTTECSRSPLHPARICVLYKIRQNFFPFLNYAGEEKKFDALFPRGAHLQASMPTGMATYTPTGIHACAPNPRNNGFQASEQSSIHTYRHRCLCAKPKE